MSVTRVMKRKRKDNRLEGVRGPTVFRSVLGVRTMATGSISLLLDSNAYLREKVTVMKKGAVRVCDRARPPPE